MTPNASVIKEKNRFGFKLRTFAYQGHYQESQKVIYKVNNLSHEELISTIRKPNNPIQK
jgi:hypothetical protein